MGRFRITTEGEEALAAATAETVLAVAGSASTKGRLVAFALSFDGVSPTAEPVQVKLKRGNSASQGTSTGCTEEKMDPDDPSCLLSGLKHFTVEPTYTGQPLAHEETHPQGGRIEWRASCKEEELLLAAATNSFLGLEVTAPAAVNVSGWMEIAHGEP